MGKAKDRSGVRGGRGLAEGIRRDWGKCEKHVVKFSVKTLKSSLHRTAQKEYNPFSFTEH
jgi:hypothetical protein